MTRLTTRLFIGTAFFGCAALLALAGSMNRGQAMEVVTDEQMSVVRSRCVELQATLNRIDERDTSIRVGLGNALTVLSDKLMTPMNQRIAANTLDGSKLLGLTASYTSSYRSRDGEDFYSLYTIYESSLRRAMQVDCIKEPTSFLVTLDTARQNRQKLHQMTEKIVALAGAYQSELKLFTDSVEESGS